MNHNVLFSKPKAIIFDVDGVIFKSRDEKHNRLWSRTIEEDLGFSKIHREKIFSNWQDVVEGKIETLQYFKIIFEDPLFSELNVSPESFIQYWLAKDQYINWDVIKFINSLNISCYLGTNQEKLRTQIISQLVGQHFKGCFSSYQIGFAKPKPNFYQHIERALKLTPTELLLIDDDVKNIESAKQSSWNVYHYQDDLKELNKFVDKIMKQ